MARNAVCAIPGDVPIISQVKIGLAGEASNWLVDEDAIRRPVPKLLRGTMLFKRLVQAATAALVLSAALPCQAQQVLKVGSTPTGIPFTFLETKSNSIQGVMVDLITEIGKDA